MIFKDSVIFGALSDTRALFLEGPKSLPPPFLQPCTELLHT